jgi:type I restriction enzyme S subunit
MQQYKTYPKYINSGIEWIGKIPKGWESRPLFTVALESYKSNKGMVENNLLSLSYGNIVVKDINSNEGLLPESFETYQIIEPDDIVFRFTDLQNDQRSLRSAISKQRGIITSAYVVVRPFSGILPSYMNYLFRSYDEQKVFYSMGGGLRQSLNYADVKRLPIVVPPVPEQKAIAAFLNRETLKIDSLISKKTDFLNLLKEKRQALITQVVTKGLDPKAKMKDSGIEWIGRIPRDWEVKRLKYTFVESRDAIKVGPFGSQLKGDDFKSEGYKVYNQRTVLDNDFLAGDAFIDDKKYKELKGFKLNPLDVVVTTRGTIGKIAVAPANIDEGIIHPCIIKFTTKKNIILDKLLKYVFNETNIIFEQLVSLSNTTTIPVVYSETLKNVFFVLPAISKQKNIINYLDTETSHIDYLIAKTEESIDLLKERRSSIITAAVTGQIDVRGCPLRC